MPAIRPLLALFSCLLLLAPVPALSVGGDREPLDLRILLTNDDGFDSAGIEALRNALLAAGHDVVVVAPATQQSGKGGSINTGIFDFTIGEGRASIEIQVFDGEIRLLERR